MRDNADLAKALWRARTQGGVIPREAANGLVSLDAAYDVQREIALLAAQPRVGWKVGATSVEAQRSFGVETPVTAPMFADHCFSSPSDISVFAAHDLYIESEFAFRFVCDLPSRETKYDRNEVLNAVGAVLPAIEVVGCRYEGGLDGLDAIRLVADMVANTVWVEGQECSDWRGLDLKSHAVRLYREDELVAEGIGAEALGDPITVLEWTVNHLSALGDNVKAGEVVSTGKCTALMPVVGGETFVADFGELGRVKVRFVQEK